MRLCGKAAHYRVKDALNAVLGSDGNSQGK
jgi:hypothetical protein